MQDRRIVMKRVVLMLVAGSVLVAVAGKTAMSGPASPAHPVVVELFTSQGCSSCPPADVFLEKLAREPGIVAIARPVTYWDRLGWKDTLAREENTNLQRAYADKGLGGAGVYTPQMVVQGGHGAVGSSQSEVRALIAKAGAQAAPQLIVGNGGITVSGGNGNAVVTLVAVKSSVPVSIGNGENGGRQIRYTNVVKAERSLGRWSGTAQLFPIAQEWLKMPGADRYAVIVQNGRAGPILTAVWL
jgi:hypothetical protein